MGPTIQDLEKRVTTLEQEVARLRQTLEEWMITDEAAKRGARLLREARANQATFSAGVAKAFAEMGITGEPVGAEKLQEMMLACGINPEDNEFSREIIAMREE
jgi:hypothetical protein